jgi:transcriptional regulator with XRE-family HTH domain
MYPPGLRLRHARERLGLTYREVERASYEVVARRGRPEFILHISRLADIENRNVVPSLHKLYSLAAIYHLNPLHITNWYEAPFEETFRDAASLPSPLTHLSEPQMIPEESNDPPGRPSEPDQTKLLSEAPAQLGSEFPGMERFAKGRYRYGHIGLSDRRMGPILRPGSLVLVDTSRRQVEDADWNNEYDRPLYFVELRQGYRCGWFQKDRSRLIMQPHTLSRCSPEVWRTPEDAEVAGQVVGEVTYLNEPWACISAGERTARFG